jgi:hypothetical protein
MQDVTAAAVPTVASGSRSAPRYFGDVSNLYAVTCVTDLVVGLDGR